MIKKEITFQGLNEVTTFIKDTSPTSPGYFNLTSLPNNLTAGKNIIRIKGNPNHLVRNAPLQIEILDVNRNPIYFEIPDFMDDDGSRIIVVYIYEDTPAGAGEITILSEASFDVINNRPIPNNQKNTINIKWSSGIFVNPDLRNNTEILFDSDDEPIIKINELVRPYLERRYPIKQFVTESAGTVSYKLQGETPTIFSSGFNFSKNMEEGTITVNPTGSLPILPDNISPDSLVYKTDITKVLTSNEAIVEDKYIIPISLFPEKTWTPTSFDSSIYSMSFEAPPTFSRTENSRSFAFIEICNMEPLSGDITRIKTYLQSKGSVGAFELVDDTLLEASDFRELLVDTGSVDVKTRIGKLAETGSITNYWKAEIFEAFSTSSGGENNPPILSTSKTALLTHDPGTILPQSVQISTDKQTFSPAEYIKFFHSGSQGLIKKEYFEKSQYVASFDAVAQPSTLVGQGINISTLATSSLLPKMDVYMSGSAFKHKPGEAHLGKKIGQIDVTNLVRTGKSNAFYRFDDHTFNFFPDKDGHGVLLFKIDSGLWNLADISIKPSLELGFSPNEITLLVPIPTEHVNDTLNFKFEYYDFENNQSKTVTTVDNCPVSGGNTYIGGGYNLLTGSLFVGSGTRTGVQLGADGAGGFMKSVGYESYRSASRGEAPGGFLLWSGSIIPAEQAELYDGVGLELHGGSGSAPGGRTNAMRFRSDTGKLEITGSIVATTATFERVAYADFFAHTQVVITNENSSSYYKYWRNHVNPTDPRGHRYPLTILDLSGLDGPYADGEAAMYVRFEKNPDFPISHIVTPGGEGFDGQILIETYGPAYSGSGCAQQNNDVYITSASVMHELSSSVQNLTFKVDGAGEYFGTDGDVLPAKIYVSSSRYQITHEEDDWASLAYKKQAYPFTTASACDSGGEDDMFHAAPGGRYLFAPGDNGWRLQSVTNYKFLTPLLYDTSISGSIIVQDGSVANATTASNTDFRTNTSVGIELRSNTKAVTISRMTEAQRDALSPVQGMIIYNENTAKLNTYLGAGWQVITSA